MDNNQIRSRWYYSRIGISIFLISILLILLFQNSQKITLSLLLWEVHLPLALLLLIMAILGMFITFIFVLILGK